MIICFSISEFDKNVRVDLAVVVTENFEKLTQQITSLNEDCMVKINATIDQCASCPRYSIIIIIVLIKKSRNESTFLYPLSLGNHD